MTDSFKPEPLTEMKGEIFGKEYGAYFTEDDVRGAVECLMQREFPIMDDIFMCVKIDCGSRICVIDIDGNPRCDKHSIEWAFSALYPDDKKDEVQS